jgi:CHAT domain-containing protein
MRAKLPVAEAMRQAQLYVRAVEGWASPYHWAAFVGVGTGQ